MNCTTAVEPFFSVIIPTCNRIDDLVNCLDCFVNEKRTHKKKMIQFEIIVTDDGFTGKTKDVIKNKFPWVYWVQGPRCGPAANRNNGASFAKGKWLVFTDDDCLPSVDLLSKYLEAITNDNGRLAFEGAVHPLGDAEADLTECPVNYDGGNFWSANIAVRRELFNKVGGFDENYPYPKNEDQDLKIRIEKEAEVQFVKDAVVYHPVRQIGLISSILTLPRICDSWSYHVTKNGEILGFQSKTAIICASVEFALRAIVRNLKNRNFRFILLNSTSLLISPFLLYFYLRKYKFTKKMRSR